MPDISHEIWTAGPESSKAISKAMAESDLAGGSAQFYASFLAYCRQQVQRAREDGARFTSQADEQSARHVLAVLRGRPLDVQAFCALWQGYARELYAAGTPDTAGAPDIEMAQKKLMQQVWSQAEREAFTHEDGGDWALSNASRDRVERARRAHVENTAHGEHVLAAFAQNDQGRPEREYRPIPQANFGGLQFNFGGLQSAVAVVEEEMEVEDTTAAMQQTEIGARKTWEEELADRTKR